MMNGHSLTHCDVNGEHRTTYARVPQPNPKFGGRTLFEWMCAYSLWLRREFGHAYVWDGDTVEFVTQRFYRATVDDVMRELAENEERFVHELAKLPKEGVLAQYGPLRLASPRNEPFAVYATNPHNVSMFNNGTIHINVTLPTQLGWNCKPMWPADFLEKHRRLARLVQWFEPLWIAAYGSGDPLSKTEGGFAAGSQRLAVSRYIGVGTFDTDTMVAGKILQVQRSEVGSIPWYDRAAAAYERLDVIGLDLNYNKHWSHGLELRFLDQLPMDALRSIIENVVVLMDIAMESRGAIADPRKNGVWQKMAAAAIFDGAAWSISPEEVNALCGAVGVSGQQKEPLTPFETLLTMFDLLEGRRGYCWRKMVVEVGGSRCLP
jgi:hypothetical protein